MTVKLVYDNKLIPDYGPSLREASKGFLISLRASASHRPKSLGALELTLAQASWFAEDNDWPGVHGITTEHIESYLAYLQVRPLFSTKNSKRTPSSAYIEGQYRRLKQFFGWQVTRGHREDNPLDIIPRPKVDQKMIQAVTEREVIALLAAIDPKKAKTRSDKLRRLRDRALVLMLWDTPGRRTEMSDLTLGDVNLDDGGITVMGKGRRQRWMPIGYTVVEATWEYLQARAQTAPLTDRLWVQTEGKPMMDSLWIHLMLQRRCEEAGIPPIHAHQFRHAYIMASLRNKTPDQIIRAATGHRKHIPETYYRTLGEDDLAIMHQEFSPADKLRQQAIRGRGPQQGKPRGRL